RNNEAWGGQRRSAGRIFLSRSAFARGISGERGNKVWPSCGRRLRAPGFGACGLAADDSWPRRSPQCRAGIRCCGKVAQQLLEGQQALRMSHLEQAELEMETLLLFVSTLAVGGRKVWQLAR